MRFNIFNVIIEHLISATIENIESKEIFVLLVRHSQLILTYSKCLVYSYTHDIICSTVETTKIIFQTEHCMTRFEQKLQIRHYNRFVVVTDTSLL